jgi:protein involved in polysaccharide export with SLBB domain
MKLLALPVLWIIPFVAQGQDEAVKPVSNGMAYVLAPMERILIRAPHAAKIDGRTFQIQPDGFVTLPSVGRIQAAGVETSVLEKTVAARLKRKPKKSGQPEVVISVVASSNK